MGEKIEIREADLGPVIARADHRDNAIEVNSEIFYKLPPMVQEFVLCHEVCHLKYDEHDEAATNRLASEVFLGRSSDDADRTDREKFLSFMSTQDYSNFAWETLIAPVLMLGTTVYGIVKERNAGWYSWDKNTRMSNLQAMLTEAFEKSRRSSKISAAQFFWERMSNFDNKDSSLDGFLNRSSNTWVNAVIAQYERKYGFGFREVTPIDITAFPVAVIAIGAAVGLLIYTLIKKQKK